MPDQSKIKTVLITGASSGIGQQVAYRFAKDGANLALTYQSNEAGIETTAEQCLKLGAGEILTLYLNLDDDQSIIDLFKLVLEKFDQIDILINNAGFLVSNNLADQNFGEIDRQININLAGLIKITSLFLPHIKESVVNVGSALGLKGKGQLAVYCATKFGVRGFSQALADEMPGLRVYAVNPSLTATKMGGPSGLPPQKVAEIIYRAAQGLYRAKSGADINVVEYQYGEFWHKLIAFLRAIKRHL